MILPAHSECHRSLGCTRSRNRNSFRHCCRSSRYTCLVCPHAVTRLPSLQGNQDLLVLTRTVFVVTVLMPLAPHRITMHLPDLYEAFTHVATLRSSEEMGRLARLFIATLNPSSLFCPSKGESPWNCFLFWTWQSTTSSCSSTLFFHVGSSSI